MVDSQPFAHRLGLLQTSLGKRPLLSALPQILFFPHLLLHGVWCTILSGCLVLASTTSLPTSAKICILIYLKFLLALFWFCCWLNK